MPIVKYRFCLSEEERKELIDITSKDFVSARAIMRANVLLATDKNRFDGRKGEAEIAKLFHVNQETVHNIRKQYAEKGLNATIGHKKRETPPIEPKITEEVEAKIIALSCSSPPEWRSRLSLMLLADKSVELNYINNISHEAVGRLLKTNSSLICLNTGIFHSKGAELWQTVVRESFFSQLVILFAPHDQRLRLITRSFAISDMLLTDL
jgi:transposase-like protein